MVLQVPGEMGFMQERLGRKLENMSLVVETNSLTLFLLIFTSAMDLSFFVSAMNA